MIYLASVPEGSVVPFREIARSMEIPQDFLAKILKTLVNAGVVSSVRGARGGYRLGRAAHDISFLDIIEAVEGPVHLNTCLSAAGRDLCGVSASCTMLSVWEEGQAKMLEVYRSARLDFLAIKPGSAQLRPLRTPESSPTA